MYVLMLDEDKSALNITILKRQNKVFQFFQFCLIIQKLPRVAATGAFHHSHK